MYVPHKKVGGRKKLTTPQFLQNAQAVHGDAYDYGQVVYKGAHVPVNIKCKKHGIFKQRPYAHARRGQGCPLCAEIIRRQADVRRTTSLGGFVTKASIIHKNKYSYAFVQYKNTHTKVKIVCPDHGPFFQRPCDHLNKLLGCPSCARLQKQGVRFSKKAIVWLETLANVQGVSIQHAGNIGEYRVPNTHYIVDGFCRETNTAYEFYGARWHGDPSVYEPNSKPHPFERNITAKQLFEKTINRENKLRELGYNVITVWETDWDKYSLQNKKENIHVNV